MAYTSAPQRWDHELIVGDTYQPAEVALVDDDGTAVSLTGATGLMQLVDEPGGAVLATGTVTITSGAGGTFTWAIAAATTASLIPQTAHYAVRITFSDGSIRTVLEGRVQIRLAACS